LLFAVRAQLEVLALMANEPVALAAEIWIDEGFKVKLHCAAADPQAASPNAKI